MKKSDWFFLVGLLALVALVALWIRHKRKKAAILATVATGVSPRPAVQGAPSAAGSILTNAEGLASKYTHVPLDQVGAAAQKAPTWLKVAVFPVGITSVTQSIINNPKAAAKKVGAIAADAGTVGENTAKAAASGVAHAATSVGHSISHLLHL